MNVKENHQGGKAPKPVSGTFNPVEAPLAAQAQPTYASHQLRPGCSVAVVGAGAFGGWTALFLARQGVKVTLLDTWGGGNSRSSSGGDSRLIRCVYGNSRVFTQMTARSLDLWRENEKAFGRQLFFKTGLLWLAAGQENSFIDDATPLLDELGLRYERLSPKEAARKYPQINTDNLGFVLYEQEAGYLKAREACICVQQAVAAAGGKYIRAHAALGTQAGQKLNNLLLPDGATIKADAFVFACGPWLGKLFPDVVGKHYQISRQEVFYFGTPALGSAALEDGLPPWVDCSSDDGYYGIPGGLNRGFKIAYDRRGPLFDPSHGNRVPDAEEVEKARKYLGMRFPAMKNAPLLESRVCQYSNTPDGNLIMDQHPSLENVWLLGGGSGHGFKNGPAIGELFAGVLLGNNPHPPVFSLSRL